MRLSVIVIARNECANMSDCLLSLDFADEVVVLDNASTDGTVVLSFMSGILIGASLPRKPVVWLP